MRYVAIDTPGQESRLILQEQDKPSYNNDQLLVRVKAAGINRADLMQRQGKYPPPPGESAIPGLEIAGEVVALGTHVKNFNVGDRVYGLVGSGGYADYCCLHHSLAAPIPKDWSFDYAAAIPEALITAHATVFSIGQLKQGQTLLIHAAGSGISSFAIQMANHIGAKVITTASHPDKMEKAKQLGAQIIINYKEDDFAELINTESVNLVVDFIGGSYFPKHLDLLKPKGKLIQIASMQGHKVECNLATLMRKRLHIIGFVLRSQSLSEKAALWKSAQEHWATPLLNKHIMPIIDSVFEFAEIEQAHARMRSSAHFGKIVIRMD
ncbi:MULTISPECIES: NAD(P)H-quinone oxidoreductase [Legionella]|uniref:Quinone oxidoreductase n=1 Tax=Legionella maceachernii TaxID=466 RepID=A0A0W0WE08_9GAMM|nr:NAD(P)H-quinone oxidoreductase [Legionella maceachernii]KTD30546.1 quinone oxidoreductase [Legionella maceachernii]SJZ77679.1 putative NAD(P)H quinone oxidoreductase, PIG3 family [Legionella maceachernii]SUP03025.1 Beta-ketoacyl-acyl-carrier-protein synthase I [Legionella maceachernii]